MFNIQTVSKAGQIFKDSPYTKLSVHADNVIDCPHMYSFILLSNWAVYQVSTMDSDTSQL